MMVDLTAVMLLLADEPPPRQLIAENEPIMGARVPGARRRRRPIQPPPGTATGARSAPPPVAQPDKSVAPDKAAREEPKALSQPPPLSEAAKLGGGIDSDLWDEIVSLAKQNQPAAEIRSQLGQRLKGVTFTVQQQVYLKNTFGIDYNQLLP